MDNDENLIRNEGGHVSSFDRDKANILSGLGPPSGIPRGAPSALKDEVGGMRRKKGMFGPPRDTTGKPIICSRIKANE